MTKENKQKLTDTDNMVVMRGEGASGEAVKNKGCQIHGDRRFDFEW